RRNGVARVELKPFDRSVGPIREECGPRLASTRNTMTQADEDVRIVFLIVGMRPEVVAGFRIEHVARFITGYQIFSQALSHQRRQSRIEGEQAARSAGSTAAGGSPLPAPCGGFAVQDAQGAPVEPFDA